MKTGNRWVLLVVMLGASLACGAVSDPSGPGNAAKRYLVACDSGDFDRAVLLTTGREGTRRTIVRGACGAEARHRKSIGGVLAIRIVEETIEGGLAMVELEIEFRGGEKLSDRRRLALHDGQWLIAPKWMGLVAGGGA